MWIHHFRCRLLLFNYLYMLSQYFALINFQCSLVLISPIPAHTIYLITLCPRKAGQCGQSSACQWTLPTIDPAIKLETFLVTIVKLPLSFSPITDPKIRETHLFTFASDDICQVNIFELTFPSSSVLISPSLSLSKRAKASFKHSISLTPM